jgi:ATP-dependent Clp protease ATP-binding subunit ClpX
MDTSNILFICGGTFVGLEEIIRRRLGKRRIGFRSEMHQTDEILESGDVLLQVQPEDLIEYGMIPEFIGRVPVITPLRPLDMASLVRVLTEPKNAIIRQYQHLFALENAKLTFTQAAMEEVARKAMERKTGARGLRGVLEQIMLELLYELPEVGRGGEFVIDRDAVRNRKPLQSLRVAHKESA